MCGSLHFHFLHFSRFSPQLDSSAALAKIAAFAPFTLRLICYPCTPQLHHTTNSLHLPFRSERSFLLRPLKELQFSNHVACGCTCCDLWIMMAIDGHPCYLSPRKGSQATSQRGQYLFAEVLQMQWRCGLKFLSNRNLKVVSNICTHTHAHVRAFLRHQN